MTREPIDILSELLVLNAQSGDEGSLAELVDLWTPRLNARARRLTRDDEASLEVLQESWIGIAKGLRRLRDPSRFGHWAMRIVSHKSADWIKARSKLRALETRLPDDATHAEPDEDHTHHIRMAIGHLDRNLRDVVYLFYMDNCTLEQVSVVLDIPIGTAKSRLARARDQLKAILEKSLERSTP
jgi:RNA polymerase sigma factor (sigma-70 family)